MSTAGDTSTLRNCTDKQRNRQASQDKNERTKARKIKKYEYDEKTGSSAAGDTSTLRICTGIRRNGKVEQRENERPRARKRRNTNTTRSEQERILNEYSKVAMKSDLFK